MEIKTSTTVELRYIALFGMLLATCGCRAPAWCSLKALHCLPNSADHSAGAYWEDCEQAVSDHEAQTPPLDSNQLPAFATHSTRKSTADTIRAKSVNGAPSAGILPQQHQPVVPASRVSFTKPTATTGMANGSATIKPISMQLGQEQDPFRLPSALPGADTPPLEIPPIRTRPDKQSELERKEAFRQIFPPPPAPPTVPAADPPVEAGVLGLDNLQELARTNNPDLRAAAAAVEVARGLMIQAGLPPNPNVGYQADTVRTAFTDGYNGAYIQQTFITAKKLGLAAQAAAVDHANAYLELRKTWYTIISSVRRQYFNALAARQRLQLAEALLELSERAYQAQTELVTGGEAAAYEPLQLFVLTTQARANVITAQQESWAAWRTLAATVGIPTLDPSAVEGRIDCAVPEVDYDAAAERMLAVHTDIRIARNLVGKNRTLIVLADRTPIPDLDASVVVQHDDTFVPGTTTYNLTLGGAIPVWNRNQGNRVAARAGLSKACSNITVTENQLIAKLASAYSNYESNRLLAASFRNDAVSEQVRAYRGIQQRYRSDPDGLSFNDIVVAQQTLAVTLTQYVDILQAQWQGTVDVAELLQVDDIFLMGPPTQVVEIPHITPSENVAIPPAEIAP